MTTPRATKTTLSGKAGPPVIANPQPASSLSTVTPLTTARDQKWTAMQPGELAAQLGLPPKETAIRRAKEIGAQAKSVSITIRVPEPVRVNRSWTRKL
jgi:hypothetical protein